LVFHDWHIFLDALPGLLGLFPEGWMLFLSPSCQCQSTGDWALWGEATCLFCELTCTRAWFIIDSYAQNPLCCPVY